jgi:hypothetical protein
MKTITKRRKRISPISKRTAKLKREYGKAVRSWKTGRLCTCAGLKGDEGKFICARLPHPATDCHHHRGRLGSLLMDQQFWVPVCARAHRFIHEHIETARNMGLICDKGEWNKPVREITP